MNRSDVVLAVLGSCNGASFSPVQLQKALFLIQRNLPQAFDDGQGFNFVPYDYGPFDRAVYDEASRLSLAGYAEVGRSAFSGYREYAATDAGQQRAQELLQELNPQDADYIRRVSDWVRSLSFAKLVRSIYEAYPEMRANSVFTG